VPRPFRWLLWDVDPRSIDPERDADYLVPRVLEHGGLAEVRWLVDRLGLDRIHRFLRDIGHPELSPRTLTLWRAVLHAEEEEWAASPPWRRHSSAPWID
jgi:hypothetical protein